MGLDSVTDICTSRLRYREPTHRFGSSSNTEKRDEQNIFDHHFLHVFIPSLVSSELDNSGVVTFSTSRLAPSALLLCTLTPTTNCKALQSQF